MAIEIADFHIEVARLEQEQLRGGKDTAWNRGLSGRNSLAMGFCCSELSRPKLPVPVPFQVWLCARFPSFP